MQERDDTTGDAALDRVRSRRGTLLLAFIGILVPLCAFGWLAFGVATHEPFAFDVPLLQALHRKASPSLDHAMLFLTAIGRGRVLLPLEALIAGALLYSRRGMDAAFFVTAVGGASLLDYVAKQLFERARPDLWVSIAPETTYSFPSAHAMQTMALCASIAVLAWPTRARWLLLALSACFVAAVGASRMYLGVHYPSDVLAGWCAAAAWVLAVRTVLYQR